MCVTAWLFKSLLPALLLVSISHSARNCEEDDCYWLKPGTTPRDAPRQKCKPREDRLYIYCYKGIELFSPEAIFRLWSSVHAQVFSSTKNYQLLSGNSSAQVVQEKNKMDSRWLYWPWHQDSMMLSPFGESCFGLVFTVSRAEFYINTTIRVIHWQFPVCLLVGLFLFFAAERMSRNPLFFYSSGMTVGVLASVLVVVYILSRLMPTKTGAYAVLIGGWTICTYFLKWMLEHFQDTILEYKEYIAGYIITAALLSFAICYYIGPPTESRRQNLAKWMIQLAALFLLYWSTQVKEASAAVIIVVLTLYMLPPAVTDRFHTMWFRMFPPRIKLLTEFEYRKQAVEFTRDQLDSLRERCQDPEFDAWGTIQRLKNPMRFAKFVQGTDHVSEEEAESYEVEETGGFQSLLSSRGEEDDIED
ncbi:nuclear envelope integral membrane protein-like [Corticium candelabrum]|uniref:nuclear envelope integral membrane protein-like n=1 Tax=Corticium candelabrum TaxID=121492 RepID=UPI002E267DB6|nr:nuclear envelope integral membrane protein-like [Corticium candelabrum]